MTRCVEAQYRAGVGVGTGYGHGAGTLAGAKEIRVAKSPLCSEAEFGFVVGPTGLEHPPPEKAENLLTQRQLPFQAHAAPPRTHGSAHSVQPGVATGFG